jgi:hypothetical protein
LQCSSCADEYAPAGFVSAVQRVEEDGTLVAEQRRFDALTSRLTSLFVIVSPSGERTDSVGYSLRLYVHGILADRLERDSAGQAGQASDR